MYLSLKGHAHPLLRQLCRQRGDEGPKPGPAEQTLCDPQVGQLDQHPAVAERHALGVRILAKMSTK